MNSVGRFKPDFYYVRYNRLRLALEYITEIRGHLENKALKLTFENKARLRNVIAAMAELIFRHPSGHIKPGFIDIFRAKASEQKVDHVYAHTVTVFKIELIAI